MNADERMKLTGQRIEAGRKELGMTQEEFLEAIHMSPKSKPALRSYVGGGSLPKMETLSYMCDLFNCDLAYLMGEIDTKRYITADVAQQTGLSPRSVGILKNWATAEQKEAVDLLIAEAQAALDLLIADTGDKNGQSRPILSTITRYMNFPKMQGRIYIDKRGQPSIGDTAGGGEWADGSLYVPSTSTVLDSATVANTILLEIQAALISLKGEKTNGNSDQKNR